MICTYDIEIKSWILKLSPPLLDVITHISWPKCSYNDKKAVAKIEEIDFKSVFTIVCSIKIGWLSLQKINPQLMSYEGG